MSFLLDTNVVSEFTRPTPPPHVVTWLQVHQGNGVYLSVVTIGDIQQGIVRLPHSQKRRDLFSWLETLLMVYKTRILPLDVPAMLQWGTLTGGLKPQGCPMPLMDALMAATVRQHNLALVTRNVADFANAGIPLIKPWDG